MVTIPPVPEGIANSANLYNDVYGDLPPLSWSNPDLHSRLAWVQSQVAFTVTAWHSSLNDGTPGFPGVRTSTMFRAEIAAGVGIDFDVRTLMQNPDVIVYALLRLRNPAAIPAQLKPYPGFEALNPTTNNPVGAAWPEHPWKGRKMFHDAGGDFKPGDAFETPDARYRKVSFVEAPGSGPFGMGGKLGVAWEQEYAR